MIHKNIYYGPDLRHKIKLVDGIIETLLQRRTWLFFWENIHPYNIHYQLRPDPEQREAREGDRVMIHLNPSIMHFQNLGLSGPLYGQRETWDESSFDLKKELYTKAFEYIDSQKVEKHYSSIAEKQVNLL